MWCSKYWNYGSVQYGICTIDNALLFNMYIHVINTDWLCGCEEISLNEGGAVRGRCYTKTGTIRRLELSRKYANARQKPAVFLCV